MFELTELGKGPQTDHAYSKNEHEISLCVFLVNFKERFFYEVEDEKCIAYKIKPIPKVFKVIRIPYHLFHFQQYHENTVASHQYSVLYVLDFCPDVANDQEVLEKED